MKFWSEDTFFVVMTIVGFIIGVLCIGKAATTAEQVERPRNTTKAWMIHELPNGTNMNRAKLEVVDVGGACIYIVRGATTTANSTAVAVAVLPKTQLPQGAGCQ